MKNKKLLFSLIIMISFGLISGCSHQKNGFEPGENTGLEQKNAIISITGNLSKNGEIFYITDSAGVIHDVETYSVSFDEYIGQTITVSGQYSGDTLFVTEISQ